jgi:hypothetical protein
MTSQTTADHTTIDISPVSLPDPDGPMTDVRLMLHAAQPGTGATTLDGGLVAPLAQPDRRACPP